MAYEVPPDRPLPDWVKGQPPTQAMADLLRAQRQATNQAEERLAAAEQRAADLAATFALALWKKRADAKDLRILFSALETAGVELIDHVGEPIAGDLEEMADIIDWVETAENIEPGCVAEAFEPEVRLNGRLAHRAKLVGLLEDTPSHGDGSPVLPSQPGDSPPPAKITVARGFTVKTSHSHSQRKRQR